MKSEMRLHLIRRCGKEKIKGDINVYTEEGPRVVYQRGQDIYTISVSTRWIWLVWVTLVYMYTLNMI